MLQYWEKKWIVDNFGSGDSKSMYEVIVGKICLVDSGIISLTNSEESRMHSLKSESFVNLKPSIHSLHLFSF